MLPKYQVRKNTVFVRVNKMDKALSDLPLNIVVSCRQNQELQQCQEIGQEVWDFQSIQLLNLMVTFLRGGIANFDSFTSLRSLQACVACCCREPLAETNPLIQRRFFPVRCTLLRTFLHSFRCMAVELQKADTFVATTIAIYHGRAHHLFFCCFF